MDKIYQRCWVALKEYVLGKNSHGKNEILEKMVRLEVAYTLLDVTGEFPTAFKNDLGEWESKAIAEIREIEDAKFIEAAKRASVEMDWPPKPLTREDVQKTFDMIEKWT